MAPTVDRGTPITSTHELESIVGTPEPRVASKTRDRLHEVDRRWLAAASLAFVATADELDMFVINGVAGGPDLRLQGLYVLGSIGGWGGRDER